MKKIDAVLEKLKALDRDYGDEVCLTAIVGEKDSDEKFIVSNVCPVCDAEVVKEEEKLGRLQHYRDEENRGLRVTH